MGLTGRQVHTVAGSLDRTNHRSSRQVHGWVAWHLVWLVGWVGSCVFWVSIQWHGHCVPRKAHPLMLMPLAKRILSGCLSVSCYIDDGWVETRLGSVLNKAYAETAQNKNKVLSGSVPVKGYQGGWKDGHRDMLLTCMFCVCHRWNL